MEKQYLIAIGLSAGGLQPLKEIIKNLNKKVNATYIIAEHHLNNSENRLKEILEKLTSIPIKYAEDEEKIKTKTIYICPSNHHIIVVNNKIELYSIDKSTTFKPSINWLFESISKYKNNAIAIILSGSLNDGSNGILNVKLQGGMVILQDPKTAEFPMMIQNCIDTKLYDFILTPKEIAKTINKLSSFDICLKENKKEILDKIFQILKNEFQIDFHNYKIGTIMRRIERRIILNKISSIKNYFEFIKNNQKEKKALFDDLLIVVTSFCRNKEAFAKLKEIISKYLKQSNDQFKIWNIGCATGEESYSLAIIIQSIIDEEKLDKDFHIFSTDISQKAIDIARNGSYPISEIEASLPTCHYDYFEKDGEKYKIIPKIRQKISFSIHNILEDTPLTKMDLIVCRNLLIYFTPEAQQKVFSLIHYALKDNGLLFIGKSEAIPEKEELLFKTLNTKTKIYQKNNNSMKLFPITHHLSKPKRAKIVSNTIIDAIKENLNTIFNTFIIIDNYGNILYTAGDFEKYLKIPNGEFSNNIFSFIDEELNLPLHTLITQTQNKLVSLNYRIRLKGKKIQYINLISIPLNEFKQNAIGIFFIPSSSEITIPQSNRSCTEIEHELIETKQKLKHTLEELSTTNEELQTSNEELQSSNEELITTNEELRAVNDNLNKINNELNEYKTKLEEKVKIKTAEILKQQKIRSALFENTNNLIVIIENDKIVDANNVFLEFFKVSKLEEFNNFFIYKNMKISICNLIKLNNNSLKVKYKNKIFLVKIAKLDTSITAINFIDITIEEEYIKTLQTEINKKIKELRKKDILLQNEYKLARMGEMLGNISHQYRQPLNLLSLILSNLEMNIENLKQKDIQKCINKSYDIIKFLSNTIDDFKNMFRPNQVKTFVNLRKLIKNVFNFIEIDKTISNLKIILKIDKNLELATYPNDLNHILLNLIHNSKDAIIETKPKNPYIKISAKQKDNDIIIKIKDNGGSIKNLHSLFTPYVSSKKDGLGIGLYMSKIIAKEKLHGKLWVKNRKKGATFYLRVKNERNL